MKLRNCYFLLVFLFCLPACSTGFDDDGMEENSSSNDDNTQDRSLYPDCLIIAQWNIGHFSNGVYENSKIIGQNYEQKRKDFLNLITNIPADIFSVNEYSFYFGTDVEGEKQSTAEVLFNDFDYQYIGHQSRYSCNAVFSKIDINNPKEQIYDCNQSAVISHTNAIKATDYYYIETYLHFKGKDILFVTTHLAFDNNNEVVATNQIRELINRYQNEEYVVLCGDWNVKHPDYFNMFVDAGYYLANHGKFGDFKTRSKSIIDNIIVKGFEIKKVYVKETSLSDHRPIVAILRIQNT